MRTNLPFARGVVRRDVELMLDVKRGETNGHLCARSSVGMVQKSRDLHGTHVEVWTKH